MNLRSIKRLLRFNYNSNKSLLEHHLNEIQAKLIFCDLLIMRDFSANVSHCVKSDRIRSFSGPYFPAFVLNTDQKNGYFSGSVRILFDIFSTLFLRFKNYAKEPVCYKKIQTKSNKILAEVIYFLTNCAS